jgi:propanol-preferring alcohol dehydrogenase
MKAMRLIATGVPLEARELALPAPAGEQVLIRVAACGVCRTDLHLADGELPDIRWPVTPGHEVVGTVVAAGEQVTRFRPGDRVGVPWLGYTCGRAASTRSGHEESLPAGAPPVTPGRWLCPGTAGRMRATACRCPRTPRLPGWHRFCARG